MWDQSDSDSDTTLPLTLEELGLGSDSESDQDNAEMENEEQRGHSNSIRRTKSRPTGFNKKSLITRGYLFEDKVDTDDIMDPADMGLQVLQVRRKGRMELFKAPVQYMDCLKGKLTEMAAKKEGRPAMDSEHWGDKPVYREN